MFQPSFLSKMVNSSELPFPSGQLQVAIDASLSEMANLTISLFRTCERDPTEESLELPLDEIERDEPAEALH